MRPTKAAKARAARPAALVWEAPARVGRTRAVHAPAQAGRLTTQTITPGQARAIRKGYGVNRHDFGRLLGYSERMIASWETGEQGPGRDVQRRYRELASLHRELAAIMKARSIPEWFQTPNAGLKGLTPIEAIERGNIHWLWWMAYGIRAGVAS